MILPLCRRRIQEEREERHKLKEQLKEATSSGRVSRFEAPELPPITPSPLSLGTALTFGQIEGQLAVFHSCSPDRILNSGIDIVWLSHYDTGGVLIPFYKIYYLFKSGIYKHALTNNSSR